MKIKLLIFFLLMRTCLNAQITFGDSLQLRTASNHPMQYFISLPDGWSKKHSWPVVFIIESADKEYKENALRFVRARQKMPFILVAPFNVNNSRSGRRDPAIFPYSSATWDLIEKTGDCKFNMDGITQIAKDVIAAYNGESKYFITGFEAGAHTVWQFVFQRPQVLRAAAPVAGNYNQNSCMNNVAFSTDSSVINLPVKGFSGDKDTLFTPGRGFYFQWQNAMQAGTSHGYRNITQTIIKGKGHVPLPNEVLSWFYEIWERGK